MYENDHFWCRGYFVDTVDRYKTAIKEYIKNQLKDDVTNSEVILKKFPDLFMG